jgi:6-phosphogluconolactonase (cycloisomerase 2 family)
MSGRTSVEKHRAERLLAWVGTYPSAGFGTAPGVGEGIWRVEMDPGTGRVGSALQVAECAAPSFLALHPAGQVLYAVSETTPGTVSAFSVHADGLTHLATVASGGASPCHLALSPAANALYVAHYVSGDIGIVPLDAEGAFAGDAQVAAPDEEDMSKGHESPGERHAHSTTVMPGGRDALVCDLGSDVLWRYEVRSDGGLEWAGVAAWLPPRTGPRHLAVGANNLLHVTGELDGSVTALRWCGSTGSADLLDRTVLGRGADAGADGHEALPAHVLREGDRLHVSVRGADVIETFRVHPDGGLRPISTTPTRGTWPRHFALVGGALVVANQVSGDVQVFSPCDSGWTCTDEAAVPAPAYILPGKS